MDELNMRPKQSFGIDCRNASRIALKIVGMHGHRQIQLSRRLIIPYRRVRPDATPGKAQTESTAVSVAIPGLR